jgi:predicted ATPase
MQHLKGFGLENFRVFKDYTWFDFAPITLLIGPNNSGKSSLIKALSLLKNIVQNQDFNLEHDEEWLQLGSFERLINDTSVNKDIITFSYPYFINNFPTVGVKKNCKIFLDFHKKDGGIRLKKTYVSLNNEILLESNSDEIRFNIQLFNNLIYLDENSIKVMKGTFEDFFVGNSKWIDLKMLKKEDEDFDSEWMFKTENISTLEIDEDYLELPNKFSLEILNLYKTNKKENRRFLTLRFDNYREVLNGYKMYFWEDEFTLKNPLISCLLENGFSNKIAKFINNKIIDYSKIQKFSCFEELNNLYYHTSQKGNSKRIYRREENDYFNNILSQFLNREVKIHEDNFLNNWSKSFKLLSYINAIKDAKFGFQTVEVGRPLVEQGFGISQLIYIMLKIIITETGSLILEEPEANLHPAFQSKLADMFLDAQKTFNQQFIIETHSEYMVRKFQYLVAKGEMKKEDIVIYYFNDPNNIPAGEPQIKKIEILEDGSLSDDFGSGFFDEATNWKFELLQLRKAQKN